MASISKPKLIFFLKIVIGLVTCVKALGQSFSCGMKFFTTALNFLFGQSIRFIMYIYCGLWVSCFILTVLITYFRSVTQTNSSESLGVTGHQK